MKRKKLAKPPTVTIDTIFDDWINQLHAMCEKLVTSGKLNVAAARKIKRATSSFANRRRELLKKVESGKVKLADVANRL